MDRLGGTLLQNRMMKQRDDERSSDRLLSEAMRRDTLGLQRDELTSRDADRSDARENRRLSLEAQGGHQQRLEAIQKEGNETKRNQQYLQFLGELNKSGQLTDDGLAKMEEAFNQQFGDAGLGVKLFRRAEPVEPTSKDMGDGVNAYWMPGSKAARFMDSSATVTEEPDEMGGGVKRKVTRKVPVGDLDAAMKGGQPESGGDPLRAAQLRKVDSDISSLADAIARGDGGTFMGMGEGNEAKLKRAMAQRAAIQGGGNPASPAVAPAGGGAKPAGVYKRENGALVMEGANGGAAAPAPASQPPAGDRMSQLLSAANGDGNTLTDEGQQMVDATDYQPSKRARAVGDVTEQLNAALSALNQHQGEGGTSALSRRYSLRDLASISERDFQKLTPRVQHLVKVYLENL